MSSSKEADAAVVDFVHALPPLIGASVEQANTAAKTVLRAVAVPPRRQLDPKAVSAKAFLGVL